MRETPYARWIPRLIWSRYTWAALGGALLAAAFPKLGFAGAAWIAPGWILFAAIGRESREVFRIGFAAGLAYALGAFYWILLIPFPVGAVAGWLALGAYMAVYMATWVWMCWRLFAALAGSAGAPAQTQGAASSIVSEQQLLESPSRAPILVSGQALVGFIRLNAPRRVLWAFLCASIWVALEMVLARLFTGFPWNLLGASQYQLLPLIQISAVTGVYGVSFMVAWFSVALASAACALLARPTASKSWLPDLICPLLALFTVVAAGSTQLAKPQQPARTLEAVLVQPSIPQTLIWDTNQSNIRFHQLVALSSAALTQNTNAQLLVWPEAAVPNMLRYELDIYQAVTNLAITHKVWIILGSDDAAPKPTAPPGADAEYDVFNSSFLVSPQGELVGSYRKRRLVIFGEYIPLERWVGFMKYLTPVGGSFAAGREPKPFIIPELGVKTSVLICFEDIFPHFTREYVEPDTDFLLNITNNGWFGESAAQWQHAANAVFRAVENRIPLVRCANNGLTCWVDSFGGMHSVYFGDNPDIYGAGFKTVDVPLLARGEKRSLTFYNRRGDVLGWSCVGLTAGLLGFFSLSSLRKRQ